MNKITAFVAGSFLALSATTAMAAGPEVIEEEDEPIAVAPVGSGLGGGAIAALVVLGGLAAMAGGSGSSNGHDD